MLSTVVHRVPGAPLVSQSFDSQSACFFAQRAPRPLFHDLLSAVLSSQDPEVERFSARRML